MLYTIAMQRPYKKALIFFSALVFLLATWSIFVWVIGPDKIVAYIGPKGYLAAFLMAVLGGVSTLTGTSFYATIALLAAGGLNPYILGIVGGIGATISDSFFYYLGTRGHDLLSGKPKQVSDKIADWVQSKPRWLIPLLMFAYISFGPLPNDIAMLALSVTDYPYRRVVPAILAGNIVFLTVLAILAG